MILVFDVHDGNPDHIGTGEVNYDHKSILRMRIVYDNKANSPR